MRRALPFSSALLAAVALVWVAPAMGQAVSTAVLQVRQLIGIGPGGTVEVVGQLQAEPLRTGNIQSIDGGNVLVSHGVRTPSVGAPDAGVLSLVGESVHGPVVSALPTCSAARNKRALVTLSTNDTIYQCRLFATSGQYGWTEPGPDTIAVTPTGQRVGAHTLAAGLILSSFPPDRHGVLISMGGTVMEPGTCSGACPGGSNATYEVVQGATTLCSVSVSCTAAEGTTIAFVACPTHEAVPGVDLTLRIASTSPCTTNPAANVVTSSRFYTKAP